MECYYARVDHPPVKEVRLARETICQCHNDQVPEDNCEGEVEALDCLLHYVGLRYHNDWDSQHVSYDRLRTIKLRPVKGCSTE